MPSSILPISLPAAWAAAAAVPACPARLAGPINLTVWVGRASQNVMKPRIQCVLAQWNPGSSASGGRQAV